MATLSRRSSPAFDLASSSHFKRAASKFTSSGWNSTNWHPENPISCYWLERHQSNSWVVIVMMVLLWLMKSFGTMKSLSPFSSEFRERSDLSYPIIHVSLEFPKHQERPGRCDIILSTNLQVSKLFDRGLGVMMRMLVIVSWMIWMISEKNQRLHCQDSPMLELPSWVHMGLIRPHYQDGMSMWWSSMMN